MRTTTKGLYALKAMLTLAACASKNQPLALHLIAEKENISVEFLQQLFFKLRKAGLIAAFRGPGGGFYPLKDKSQISVLEVLEAVGESLEISPCPPGAGDRAPCPQFGNCPAGRFWLSLEQKIREYASSQTLADLIKN